jgi:hypothetical protein
LVTAWESGSETVMDLGSEKGLEMAKEKDLVPVAAEVEVATPAMSA